MAIDLLKLEQKFNALLDDPNFVTDFEQWLEARNVSQNSSKPIVSGGASASRLTYVQNCFWWIEQFFENNVTKEQAEDAVDSLLKHIREHRR